MLGDGLNGENVDRRPGDLARVKRRPQVLLDDQLAPRDVQDSNAVLALGQGTRVKPPSRLGRPREVKRDERRALLDRIGACRALNSELAVALGRHVGVEGDDPHPE